MPFTDVIFKCEKSDHIVVALIGLAVAAAVASLSFATMAHFDEEDYDKNDTARNLSTILLIGAALALGWGLKGRLPQIFSSGTDWGHKGASFIKLGMLGGIFALAWIAKGRIDNKGEDGAPLSPGVLMYTAGGLGSAIALASLFKVGACITHHGSYGN